VVGNVARSNRIARLNKLARLKIESGFKFRR
jgi:hypothetical protein